MIRASKVIGGLAGGAAVMVLLAAAAAAQGPAAAAQPPRPVNADAAIQVAFDKRVKQYVELHRKLEHTLPPLSREATAAEIEKHQRSLARLLQDARPGTQAGTLFDRDTRALFRRLLSRVLSGPDGAKVKAAIMEDNPGPIKVQVNGRYPDAPVSTVPAQVLASLPKLPEELEYRFVGERLILLDAHAHIVLDYIDNALPR